MVPNQDSYTKAYIKEGWASLGFYLYDTFDDSQESNQPFGNGGEYHY